MKETVPDHANNSVLTGTKITIMLHHPEKVQEEMWFLRILFLWIYDLVIVHRASSEG